jgi:hypothetical protein
MDHGGAQPGWDDLDRMLSINAGRSCRGRLTLIRI